jgi:4-amino-4-deoxy-L-arabinose transferase-like glycosyltransferase
LTEAPTRKRFPHAVLLLLGLSGWLFLFHLGSIPLLGKDEPKNAEATREMMERGDWVTPTLSGELWFDKPILIYWSALLAFHLLGPGELAARLPSAVFGMAGVLLTWAFARRLFGEAIGLRSGIILATSLEYFWFSRTAVTDIPLTFFVTLSVASFYYAVEGLAPRRWAYPLAFAAAGAAVLAKGPVGAILPALVAAAYLALQGRLAELRRVPWLASLAAFFLVVAPWYVAIALRHGSDFWNEFIVNRNLQRYTTDIHNHPGPVYYYLPVLVIAPFPWGALFPFSVWTFLRHGREALRTRLRAEGFLLLWVLLPLLFFSFAGSKLPSYLLPCFPAIAILTALGWREIFESEPASRLRPWSYGFLLAIFPILMFGIYRWTRSDAPGHLRLQIPLGVMLLLTAGALAGLAALRRRHLLFRACAVGSVASLTALVACSLSGVREDASLTRIAAEGVRLARQGHTVVAYKQFHNYLYFYTENRVPFVKQREELERLVDRDGTIYCFLEEPGLKNLRADPPFDVVPLDRQHTVTLARVSRPQGGAPDGGSSGIAPPARVPTP